MKWYFFKDWIFINFFNIISINWDLHNTRKKLKGVYVPLECCFRFTKNYSPFMFNVHYGKLLSINIQDVKWKDKYNTPRHEENPLISIRLFNKYFFNWEWKVNSSLGEDIEYWEQAIWYLYYCDKNIDKAKQTWPWKHFETNISTWNDKFLIK